MARRTFGAWMLALAAMLMIFAAQPQGAQNAAAKKSAASQKAGAKPKPMPTTTLTGCLKMDGKQYELTDLKGNQAPTGRSWKSGFIKKTTKNVRVVGASSNVNLWEHVNRQVSVVGTKQGNTHLRANSIKRVAASCS